MENKTVHCRTCGKLIYQYTQEQYDNHVQVRRYVSEHESARHIFGESDAKQDIEGHTNDCNFVLASNAISGKWSFDKFVSKIISQELK